MVSWSELGACCAPVLVPASTRGFFPGGLWLCACDVGAVAGSCDACPAAELLATAVVSLSVAAAAGWGRRAEAGRVHAKRANGSAMLTSFGGCTTHAACWHHSCLYACVVVQQVGMRPKSRDFIHIQLHTHAPRVPHSALSPLMAPPHASPHAALHAAFSHPRPLLSASTSPRPRAVPQVSRPAATSSQRAAQLPSSR